MPSITESDERQAGGSVRRTLARNTLYNAAGRLWDAASGLVLTAYILEDRVSMTAWGLWALVNIFTGYMGLLDFGIGSSFAKYIAEHAARNEDDEMSEVVSTGFIFYLLFGGAVIAVGWPCIDLLVNLLSYIGPDRAGDFARPEYSGDVRFLLRGGLALFAASNCVAAFTAVQTGLQRMGITNVLGFVSSIVKIVMTVFFLETGHGVRGLLYANFAVIAIFGVASVAIAFRLRPALRVTPRRVTRRAFSKLFSFGWRAQVAKLSNLIMFQTDSLVIAVVYKYFGLIGLYDLGVNMANKMRQVPLPLVSALVPAASHLDAHEDHERLRELYVRSTKYVALVAVPLAAFTVGLAGPLMRTWLGQKGQLDVACWVLRIIAFGYVANLLPGAGVGVVLGKGRADLQMKAGAIATVSNLVLTILLVFTVGFYGIAIATSISMFLSCAWFFRALKPLFGISGRELMRASVLWPAAAAAPGFVVCAIADCYTSGMADRAPNAVAVIVCAAIFAASYAALLRLTPFLDAYDAEFFEKTAGFGRIPGFRLLVRRARRV